MSGAAPEAGSVGPLTEIGPCASWAFRATELDGAPAVRPPATAVPTARTTAAADSSRSVTSFLIALPSSRPLFGREATVGAARARYKMARRAMAGRALSRRVISYIGLNQRQENQIEVALADPELVEEDTP